MISLINSESPLTIVDAPAPRRWFPSLLLTLQRAAGLPLWAIPTIVIAATLLLNGYPRQILSGGYFEAAALLPLLLIRALEPKAEPLRLSIFGMAEAIALLMLAAAGTVGFFFSIPEDDSLPTLLYSLLVPIAAYFLILRVEISYDTIQKIIIVYLAAACYIFVNALFAFYKDFGIPSSVDLLTARFQLDRLAGYMNASYGFISNTGSILAFCFPLGVMALFYGKFSPMLRVAIGLVLAVLFVNIVIIQVRALILVVLFMFLLISLKRGIAITIVAVGVLAFGVGLIAAIPGVGDKFISNMTAAATANSGDDNSVFERLRAMDTGIDIASKNWEFGIGPGQSIHRHPAGSAHQFLINQTMELGVLGLVAWLVVSVICGVRYLLLFFDSKRNPVESVVLAGPFFFLVYAWVANAPLSITSVNAWSGSLMLFLALAASRIKYDNGPVPEESDTHG